MNNLYHFIRMAIPNLLFFFITTNYCVAQNFEIKYYPAFHNRSKCTIYCDNDSCKIQLDVFARNDSAKSIWSETRLVPDESVNQLKDFFKTEEDLFENDVLGLDGIHIIGIYEEGTLIKKFKFWSPLKRTREYELFKISIKIMGNSLKTRNSKRYLRSLKKYLN